MTKYIMESHFLFETVINYRDDFNGRPKSIIAGDHILLVTHPFYCFADSRYGRCYRYNVISKEHHKFIDVDFYTFDDYYYCHSYIDYSDVFCLNLETIMNYLSDDNNGNLLFACIDKHNVSFICFVPINKSVMLDDLVNEMEAGKISDIIAGFVRYNKKIYTIYHFTKEQMKEPNENNNTTILPVFELFNNNECGCHQINFGIPWTKTGDVLVDQLIYYYHKEWDYETKSFNESFCEINEEEIKTIDFRSFFIKMESPITVTSQAPDLINPFDSSDSGENLSSIGSDDPKDAFEDLFEYTEDASEDKYPGKEKSKVEILNENEFIIDTTNLSNTEYLESIPDSAFHDYSMYFHPKINYINPKIKNTVKKFLILNYDVSLIRVPDSLNICGCTISNNGHIQIMIW